MKWYDIYQSILTIIITLIVAWITYQQYKTDRRNVNLAIYEKRYRVYDSVMRLIAKIVGEAQITIEDIRNYTSSKIEADFLFDKDIIEHLDLIYKQAIAFDKYNKSIKIDDGEKRNIAIDKKSELLQWFAYTMEPTKKLFSKYLHYSSLK